MSRPRARRWLLALGLLVVALAAVASATGLAVADGTTLQANNSTVQHENPDEVGDRSELGGLSNALADRLARQLGNSSIQLSQNQYDQARDLVGEDTRSTFGKFVDVAGETEDESDDETAETVRETRENQREFINSTQEYRETYDEYQEAKENGNEQRARRLARELERLEQDVRQNGTAVRRSYGNISNQTGTDLSEATEAVNRTIQNVSEQQAEVRAATFLRTNLTVTAMSRTVSFTSPLTLEGRLTAENGTAVADRTVTVRVAGQTYTVETNATGAFDFWYRPTTLRLDTRALTVAYRPEPTSVYLGSNDSVDVDVEQVTPTVTLSRSPATVGFGDRLSVSGRVGANDTGAAGVPLVVTVGEERVARTTTGPSGTYDVAARLPASVIDGTRRVQVTVDQRDRALALASASKRVTVAETPSTVTVTATQLSEGSSVVVVQGRVTGAGQGVPSTLVRLRLGGTDVGSVRTNETGWFRTTVDAAATLETGNGTVTREVVARYDGGETSLEASNATATVQLSFPADGNGDASNGGASLLGSLWRYLQSNPLLTGAAALLVVGNLVVWGLVIRSRQPTAEGSTEDAGTVAAGETTEAAGGPSRDPLGRAREVLAGGDTDAAVRLSFAAVRGAFPEADSSQSHWEFYRTCAANGYDAERVAALRELTEGYERAAFAPGSVSETEASEVVDAAGRALSGGEALRASGAASR